MTYDMWQTRMYEEGEPKGTGGREQRMQKKRRFDIAASTMTQVSWTVVERSVGLAVVFEGDAAYVPVVGTKWRNLLRGATVSTRRTQRRRVCRWPSRYALHRLLFPRSVVPCDQIGAEKEQHCARVPMNHDEAVFRRPVTVTREKDRREVVNRTTRETKEGEARSGKDEERKEKGMRSCRRGSSSSGAVHVDGVRPAAGKGRVVVAAHSAARRRELSRACEDRIGAPACGGWDRTEGRGTEAQQREGGEAEPRAM